MVNDAAPGDGGRFFFGSMRRMTGLRLAVALLLGAVAFAEAPLPPDAEIDGMRQAARRARVKPFDLIKPTLGMWPSERLVMQDKATGTAVWRMSANPGQNRHDATLGPWNADGSLIAVGGIRGDRGGVWIAEANGSGWRSLGWQTPAWCPDDPRKAYVFDPGAQEIQKLDVDTNQHTVVWKAPFSRCSFAPVSPDGKWLLVLESPQNRSGGVTTAWIVDATGKEEPRKREMDDLVHEAWFLKRGDAAFLFDYERQDSPMEFCDPGKDFAIKVIDPMHFQNGSPSPSGKLVAHVRQNLMVFDMAKGENRQVMRLPPQQNARAFWDADDAHIGLFMSNQISLVATDSGKLEPVCAPNSGLGYGGWNTDPMPVVSPDGTKIGFASTMLGDIDFYVAVRRLPDPPRDVVRKGKELSWKPPARCRELAGYRVWKDGKPLPGELLKATSCEADMSSTYVVTAVEHSGLESEHTDSTAPKAPTAVQAAALDAWTVEIAWDSPEDADIAYFNVYAGPGAEKRAPAARVASPITTRHIEWGLPAGSDLTFTVTAVDGAGNESPASAPAKVKLAKAPAFHKVIPVGKRAPADVAFDLASDSDVVIWVSLRLTRAGQPPPMRATIDGSQPRNWAARWDLTIAPVQPQPDPPQFWDTFPAGEAGATIAKLAAGKHTISITAPDGQVEIASVVVTADRSFVPEGITSFLARRPK